MQKRKKCKILCVVGARPNFLKIAPILTALKQHRSIIPTLLHTGQHYDFMMSEVFFKDLSLPAPDIYLGTGRGGDIGQISKIMAAFERRVKALRPDLTLVVGDVNSTLACALASAKMGIKVAHVEAGLRSFDRSMPEELNRKLTDAVSDHLFVSEESGLKNLADEGIDRRRVFFAGNVMIDTLISNMPAIERSAAIKGLGPEKKPYAVLTLHRPSNVDSRGSLREVHSLLSAVGREIEIVYLVHPRAMKMIRRHGFLKRFRAIRGLKMARPLGYLDFIKLVKGSAFVLTDSGGIQEETTALDIPCLTMRENTERPVTITRGTNHLVGRNIPKIRRLARDILRGRRKRSAAIKGWDGKASERIVDALKRVL
jgi:UDP-N-acetylglucosamine 2-epimerase (non-hydrolysing)